MKESATLAELQNSVNKQSKEITGLSALVEKQRKQLIQSNREKLALRDTISDDSKFKRLIRFFCHFSRIWVSGGIVLPQSRSRKS